MNVNIKKIHTTDELQHCLEIRRIVFVEGQDVPVADDLDGKDDTSIHYLLAVDDHPAATARVRLIDDYAKIERVAVLDSYRGKGYGLRIMEFILQDLQASYPIKAMKLSSQTYAIPFYEKLGFKVCSEEYLDSNILHKDMIMQTAIR